jgi:uncharacterized protein (DUF4415 family)
MSEESRQELSEQERREIAFEHRGEVVEDSAEDVHPRRMPQVVSLRLDPDVISQLRDVANQRGTTVSDLLREGADCIIGCARSTIFFSSFTYRSSSSGHTVGGRLVTSRSETGLTSLSRTG